MIEQKEFSKRLESVSYPSLDRDITVNGVKLMVMLEMLLEESANGNYEWWKEKEAMYINGNFENIPNSADIEGIEFIKEAVNTMAQMGLLEIERGLELITKE
jgi:hypothetical protein